MNEHPVAGSLRKAVAEAVGVVGVGLVVALVANGVSPRGLSLTRDYFPKSTGTAARPEAPSVVSTNGDARVEGATGSPAVPAGVEARLREQGLTPLSDEETRQLFDDPRRLQEQIVFVDARDDRHFQAGHIPGAHPFDRYHPEESLPRVLAAGQQAERWVVYCNGGECDDSVFAAMALRDAGVPAERLAVYVGGITAWEKLGFPIETGDRGSGVMRPTKP